MTSLSCNKKPHLTKNSADVLFKGLSNLPLFGGDRLRDHIGSNILIYILFVFVEEVIFFSFGDKSDFKERKSARPVWLNNFYSGGTSYFKVS